MKKMADATVTVETCVYPREEIYFVRKLVHQGVERFRWFVGEILATSNDKVRFF